ncbi:sigma-70 family RNA polymerase sigma factor [Asticcacaulis sp. BYS171W]|uniref:Sigma-70 family RNA polymerase sigma factor n=1 Tax=Asticcacaulis aquaticus TaxID=2984212 RepID=A0ABT5HY81_9CAUL|nr:sigma-70 family RNA polymerase sigma factor [Asticcacaulis aquaticus]MDC7684893.1 sigma-70 family RNA polymerase sigma factor [Asticcacaulis aquaticus]
MPPHPAAFADWIGPHLSALRRISRAFAAPADQPDLLQELMISCWKAHGAFRGDSAAATFIYRVAHNRALTWKKREGLRLLRLFETQRDLPLLDEATDSAPLERIYEALRDLSPIDRSLMLLWLEQVSYADMAALHGLTESNIGVRLTRARTRLATLIKDDPDEA